MFEEADVAAGVDAGDGAEEVAVEAAPDLDGVAGGITRGLV